jgi:hypothetical protein
MTPRAVGQDVGLSEAERDQRNELLKWLVAAQCSRSDASQPRSAHPLFELDCTRATTVQCRPLSSGASAGAAVGRSPAPPDAARCNYPRAADRPVAIGGDRRRLA